MSRIGSVRVWACLALALALGACGWVDIRPDSERTVRQAAPPPAPAAPAAPAAEPGVTVVDGVRYVEVMPGDTVFGIADQYKATPNQIIRLNRLDSPFTIQVGQRLRLPSRQRLHRVRSGETLTAIARRYDVAPELIADANGLAPPFMVRADETLGVPTEGAVVAVAPAASGVARRAPVRSAGPSRDRQGVKVEELPPPATPAVRTEPSAAAAAPVTPPSTSTPAPAPAPRPSAARIEPSPQPAQPQPAPAPAAPERTELARVDPAEPPPAEAPRAGATPPGGPSLATPGIRGGFLAPIDGPVIAGFGSQADGRRNDGVNVAAPKGAPVRAAADGEVVYAGDALQGYGNLILVRHNDGWVTAYAHLDSILAKRGETVKRGQTIGSVGSSGGVGAPQLHFEMRQNNKAVDPIGRLAPT